MPAIDWAKQLGFHVIVSDKKADAPGKAKADLTLSFDATNVRGITTWALQNNVKYNIRLCHCGSDFGLLTAAIVSDALGLLHSPIEAVLGSLDKALMKQRWLDKINCPRSAVIQKPDEARKFAVNFGWPIIIKPTAASGSQGVGLAKESFEIEAAFNQASNYARDGKVIVEQYIRGTHHDVNGIFWQGKFFPAGIGDRFFTQLPYFVPHHGYFPSQLALAVWQTLYNLLEQGARAIGITHGPVKADCVIRDNECYVYEITNRFHGDIFTVRTMGFLGEFNPLRQFFKWVSADMSNAEYKIYSAEKVGAWKTIFNPAELLGLKSAAVEGVFVKNNEQKNSIVKNNDEIAGLAWAYGVSREQTDKILNIDKNYETI